MQESSQAPVSRSIKEAKCLDEADCERLDQMRFDLEGYRRKGLTDKNMALIRQVLTPGIWKFKVIDACHPNNTQTE